MVRIVHKEPSPNTYELKTHKISSFLALPLAELDPAQPNFIVFYNRKRRKKKHVVYCVLLIIPDSVLFVTRLVALQLHLVNFV